MFQGLHRYSLNHEYALPAKLYCNLTVRKAKRPIAKRRNSSYIETQNRLAICLFVSCVKLFSLRQFNSTQFSFCCFFILFSFGVLSIAEKHRCVMCMYLYCVRFVCGVYVSLFFFSFFVHRHFCAFKVHLFHLVAIQ